MDAVRSLVLATSLGLTASVTAVEGTACTAAEQPGAGVEQGRGKGASHGRGPSLDQMFSDRLEHYSGEFPDILFVKLGGAENWAQDLVTIAVLLGPEPASLDYEHPPEVREELMTLSFARLRLMLRHKAPSASLFRAADPSGRARAVCVITVDPETIAHDDGTATGHLLSLPPGHDGRVPTDLELPHRVYLNFVIDHEIFHCLSSRHNGPQPQSFKPLWADFWHFREENGADAFAIAMHTRRHGQFGRFADNLKRLRATAIVAGDTNHWTYRALDTVMQDDPSGIATLSIAEVFEYATAIRDALVPDYDAYLRYVRSADIAMERLGLPRVTGRESLALLGDIEPEPDLVAKILRATRQSVQELAPGLFAAGSVPRESSSDEPRRHSDSAPLDE
jgi:hypothetical protein